jgi:hypothetical protein
VFDVCFCVGSVAAELMELISCAIKYFAYDDLQGIVKCKRLQNVLIEMYVKSYGRLKVKFFRFGFKIVI